MSWKTLAVLLVLAAGLGGPSFHLGGTVRNRIYLGDQTEYRITTDQVGELVVRRQNASGVSTGLGPGEPVVVRWHEEANLVLVG